jgi:hypothetical protein
VLIALGHARRRAALGDGVEGAFFEAARAARHLRRPDLLISAALGLCAVPFSAGDRAVDPAVVDLLEEALEAAPESDTATRARLLARLAGELYYDPLRATPVEVAEEAAALARRANEPAALVAALEVSHLAFRGGGATNDRLALARELVGLARKSGDFETLVPALVHQTVAQVEHGDLKALETNAGALTALASELRQPAYAWWALLWRATAAIVGGRLGEGEELAQHAYAAGRAGFGEAAELELRAQLLWLRLEREQLGEVAASLPALEGSFSALPVWGPLKARVLAGVARSDEASATIAGLTEKGLTRLGRDTNWPISAWLLAETFARTGEPEGAALLRVALEPRAAQWAVSARGTVCFGPLTGALALLCVVEGRVAEADRYYATALERSRSAGARLAAERLQREYELCRPAALTRG